MKRDLPLDVHPITFDLRHYKTHEIVSRHQVATDHEAQAIINGAADGIEPVNYADARQDYYLIFVAGCVEPEVMGPYTNETQRREAARKIIQEEGDEKNAIFPLDISKGSKVEVYGFVGVDLGE